MGVFVLHAGQPELSSFLRLLRVPSGTALPSAGPGGERWTVLSFRGADAALPPEASGVSQPAHAVRRALNARLRRADLRRHGLRAAEPRDEVRGALVRRYVVPVFGPDALGVYAPDGAAGTALAAGPIGGKLAPVPPGADGRLPTAARRAERAAIRAVYALGLDYAVVVVRLDAAGLPLVASIDPTPLAAAGLFAAAFAEAVNRLQAQQDEERSASRTLLFGMDPEFVLRRAGPDGTGKIVSASRYFDRRGVVGCDSVRIGDRLAYPLAELRPSPAAEPQELLRNLYAAMRLAASRIDDAGLEWLAGGMPAPGLALGGHIHVSGVGLNADLLRALDNYVALPLALLEDSASARRRPRYGALGDFRRQFHGGFEYRTLPSWIVSPAVALGVLSLAKVVCEHYRELRERPLARVDMQIAYYAGDKEAMRPAALAAWRELEGTAGYARYAKALDRLKRRIDRMEPWNGQSDVRAAWKIPPYRV